VGALTISRDADSLALKLSVRGTPAEDIMPIFYSEKSLVVLGKVVTKTQFVRWHYISCSPAIFLRGLLLRISGWFTRSPVL
jgi:hypothetical protein